MVWANYDYFDRPMKSGGDDFYGQMAALVNEDVDDEEEVRILNMCGNCVVLLYVHIHTLSLSPPLSLPPSLSIIGRATNSC